MGQKLKWRFTPSCPSSCILLNTIFSVLRFGADFDKMIRGDVELLLDWSWQVIHRDRVKKKNQNQKREEKKSWKKRDTSLTKSKCRLAGVILEDPETQLCAGFTVADNTRIPHPHQFCCLQHYPRLLILLVFYHTTRLKVSNWWKEKWLILL